MSATEEKTPREKKLQSSETLQSAVDKHYEQIGDEWEITGDNTYNIIHIGFPGDIERTNTDIELEVIQPLKDVYPKPIVIIDWQAEHLTVLSHVDIDKEKTLEFWDALESQLSDGFDVSNVDDERLIVNFEDGSLLREKPVPRVPPQTEQEPTEATENAQNDDGPSSNGETDGEDWEEQVRQVREEYPEGFIEIDEEKGSIHVDSHNKKDPRDLYDKRSNHNVETWDEYKEKNQL